MTKDDKYEMSGINSLAGFAFQIKVFFYYALLLEQNSIVEFETLDDVTVKKPLDLDKKEDLIKSLMEQDWHG